MVGELKRKVYQGVDRTHSKSYSMLSGYVFACGKATADKGIICMGCISTH